jgi:hypothetical protein
MCLLQKDPIAVDPGRPKLAVPGDAAPCQRGHDALPQRAEGRVFQRQDVSAHQRDTQMAPSVPHRPMLNRECQLATPAAPTPRIEAPALVHDAIRQGGPSTDEALGGPDGLSMFRASGKHRRRRNSGRGFSLVHTVRKPPLEVARCAPQR